MAGFFLYQILKDFEQICPEVPKQKPPDKRSQMFGVAWICLWLGFQPVCQVNFGEEGEHLSKAEVVLGEVAQWLQKDLPLG